MGELLGCTKKYGEEHRRARHRKLRLAERIVEELLLDEDFRLSARYSLYHEAEIMQELLTLVSNRYENELIDEPTAMTQNLEDYVIPF